MGMRRSAPLARRLAPRTPAAAGERCHAAIFWLHRVLIVVLAVYFLTTVPGVRGHSGYNPWIDNWLQNGILGTASVIVLLRAVSVRSGRLGWALVGVGLALFALGSILYFSYVQYEVSPPTPSVADVPWLFCYVFLYGGLVVLVRRRISGSDRTAWLDGLLATLGVTAIGSIWLQYLLSASSGGAMSIAVTMAYPGGDLILLMIIIAGGTLIGSRPDRAIWYLGAGMLLFATADTVYTIRIAAGTYHGGTMLDPLWAVAVVLIAAAALRPPAGAVRAQVYGWAPLVLPTAFTISSITILVIGSLHDLPLLTSCLATAALLVGLVRAGVSFREVQRLAVSRTEARTDELTGLGNRRQFTEVASARLARRGADHRHAVMLIDLDLFKDVNDTHGHAVGDAILVQVAQRLSVCMRSDDTLVRLGGDEYAALLSDVTVPEALDVGERIRSGLREPLAVDSLVIHLDVSIGIAVYPEAATTVAGLLHGADSAMYEAKAGRLGCVVFESGDDTLTARRQLLTDLQTAIREGQLVLHFQPKVDLLTTTVCGVEALVRWNHPERGLLYPDTFIPAAERYGFMRGLTTTVLALALDQARDWRAAGSPMPVAVNVSAANLADPELPGQVADLLAVRGLDGSALVIEVTETMLMNDTTRALSVLHGLRALGVRISIDDYGTGYSSLSRLRDLPINELKLDRSFIMELEADPRTAAIVDSTIRLAHSLGMTVVAEGIETAATLALLTAMHCDVGQGYHLGRPVPAANIALPAVLEVG
ncbi:MAG: diguanylate cyclase [Frankiales bacterium]|nr:diguanylate cyclase [Frankiales bacterium]